ncbi:DHH family phosphoesterase [Salsuginibacillus kocurii]|uniref:DHH family phosphoesterase n=1 Tax=Salsuginibacillus kocurii TaxID=427078 RepID=UPI00037B2314|nr:bifunctional oligoribonuclease/PAP phosphatase NrnA [Salsuginibacillus kocurii]
MIAEIIKKIEEYETIIIHRHESPDPDALGSQGGLAELVKTNYPHKSVLVTGEDEPSLAFLGEMDGVHDRLYEQALVIVCDTANTERISDQRYTNGNYLIKIDHHPNEEPYGDLVWVDTNASSTSEMIVRLYEQAKEEQKWELSEVAAYLLYAGIVGDTGRFRFTNTTPRTFAAAATLLTKEIDTTELYTKMYTKPLRLVRFQGDVLQQFELTEVGAGYGYITQKQLKERDVTITESSAVVNAVADIEGIKAWVFFVENEDGTYRVRLRSKAPVINDIAMEHNGGGHALAAGAKAADFEETEQIIAQLQAKCS